MTRLPRIGYVFAFAAVAPLIYGPRAIEVQAQPGSTTPETLWDDGPRTEPDSAYLDAQADLWSTVFGLRFVDGASGTTISPDPSGTWTLQAWAQHSEVPLAEATTLLL